MKTLINKSSLTSLCDAVRAATGETGLINIGENGAGLVGAIDEISADKGMYAWKRSKINFNTTTSKINGNYFSYRTYDAINIVNVNGELTIYPKGLSNNLSSPFLFRIYNNTPTFMGKMSTYSTTTGTANQTFSGKYYKLKSIDFVDFVASNNLNEYPSNGNFIKDEFIYEIIAPDNITIYKSIHPHYIIGGSGTYTITYSSSQKRSKYLYYSAEPPQFNVNTQRWELQNHSHITLDNSVEKEVSNITGYAMFNYEGDNNWYKISSVSVTTSTNSTCPYSYKLTYDTSYTAETPEETCFIPSSPNEYPDGGWVGDTYYKKINGRL